MAAAVVAEAAMANADAAVFIDKVADEGPVVGMPRANTHPSKFPDSCVKSTHCAGSDHALGAASEANIDTA